MCVFLTKPCKVAAGEKERAESDKNGKGQTLKPGDTGKSAYRMI